MTTMFYDRTGKRIQRSEYKELVGKEGYSTVRQFLNDKLKVVVTWTGTVTNGQNYMPAFLPLFKIEAWNRVMNYEGNMTSQWAKDPVLDQTYSSESEAVRAYEVFLEQWTASGYGVDAKSGNKVFLEDGNVLTPPPPPDPDAPSIVSLGETDCDEVGAW